jgi:hypothetical protein
LEQRFDPPLYLHSRSRWIDGPQNKQRSSPKQVQGGHGRDGEE